MAVSVNLLSLHCADCVLDIRNSSGTNDVPRTVLLNISTTTYTCYVAPATFDNNKSDDSEHHTRRQDAESTHSIAARRGPHHIHYACCCRVILRRPPHDRRLALQISHDRYSITKESKKKNLIHFPVLRLFVDSAARLVISYRHHHHHRGYIDRANYLNTKEGQNLQTILHHSALA